MMKRRMLLFLALPLVAGCLTSEMPEASRWPVDYVPGASAVEKASYGVARVSLVTVRAPYDSDCLAVLRADGSVSFDSYNAYATAPAQLLRGCVFDALVASGRFSSVVNASSSARSDLSVEVMVTRLALDCRDESDGRKASVELVLRLVDAAGVPLLSVRADDSADAADGNFGKAFSAALSGALERALAEVR